MDSATFQFVYTSNTSNAQYFYHISAKNDGWIERFYNVGKRYLTILIHEENAESAHLQVF